MKGHGAKLNRKMESVIVGLLTQRNVEEAAKTAGVGTATLLRWQKLRSSRSLPGGAARRAWSVDLAATSGEQRGSHDVVKNHG